MQALALLEAQVLLQPLALVLAPAQVKAPALCWPMSGREVSKHRLMTAEVTVLEMNSRQ